MDLSQTCIAPFPDNKQTPLVDWGWKMTVLFRGLTCLGTTFMMFGTFLAGYLSIIGCAMLAAAAMSEVS